MITQDERKARVEKRIADFLMTYDEDRGLGAAVTIKTGALLKLAALINADRFEDAQGDAQEAAAKIAELEAAQDEVKYTAFCSLWTSVDDALPVEPGRYLVCMDSANGPFIAGYHRGRGWERPELNTFMGNPPTLEFGQYITHWMALPGTYAETAKG